MHSQSVISSTAVIETAALEDRSLDRTAVFKHSSALTVSPTRRRHDATSMLESTGRARRPRGVGP
jgi:hypothetical protein